MHFAKLALAGALSLLIAHGSSAAVSEQNWSYVSDSPLSFTDANGITTAFSYYNRGWVTESRVRHPSGDASLDHVTSYEYDAVGQLTRLTLAHRANMIFQYGAARRLTALENDLGERKEYTLDAAGNRSIWISSSVVFQIHS